MREAGIPSWVVPVGRDWTTPAVGSMVAVEEAGRVVSVIVAGVCEHEHSSAALGSLCFSLPAGGDYAALGPVVSYRHRAGACAQCAARRGGQHVTRAGHLLTWAPAPEPAGALF